MTIFKSKLLGLATALALVLAGGSLVTTASDAAEGAFSDDQKKSIEKIVRDYLLNNPEILFEVQSALEKKMEVARAQQMEKSLAANADQLFRAENAAFIGNPKGDVTVVEFFDYNCGYCKRALGDVAKLAESDKNIKIVFKELPIFGKESEDAARVALAARVQGKYWEIHKDLLTSDGRANEAKALRIAEKHGLDMSKLKADMKSTEVSKAIDDTRKLAQEMGINGTPHFFVGNRMIPGAPDNLLDQIRKHAAAVRTEGCKFC